MKNLIIILLFLNFSIQLFALDISKSKIFTETLTSTKLKLNINITLDSYQRGTIEKRFEYVSDDVEDSELCIGGTYNIFILKQNSISKKVNKLFNSDTLTYRGNISYECIFKDKKKMEDLIDKLTIIKDIEINQSPITNVLDQKKINIKNKILEKRAYAFANKESNNYSIITNKKCTTSSIKFSQSYRQQAHRALVNSKSSSSNIIEPLNKNVEIKLNVAYIFTCK